MPLETGTYISDLNASNPPGTDGLSQADDHLRLIKQLLKATFPGITGAVTATQAELNQLHTGTRTLGLANGVVGTPSLYFDADTDLGLYRVAANQMGVAGRLFGNGAKDTGELCMFLLAPSTMATGGTATGVERYIELDGSTYTGGAALFPDLATAFPSWVSAGNLIVPDWKTTGRFPRSRTGSVAVGTLQSNQNKTHDHGGTALSSGSHSHSVTGTGTLDAAPLARMDASATVTVSGSGGGNAYANGDFTSVTVAVNAISGTAATAGAHTHTISSDGGTEARPETGVCVFAVKT